MDDQRTPFFIHGEAAWSMLTQLPREKIELYLEDRYQKGINAIIANLIESTYTANPPANARGHRPFTTRGDFTTPNEDYFADIDWALTKAAEKGFVVLLNPAYMGFRGGDIDTDTDGWWSELEQNGPEAARWYGRWLGKRYRAFPNIIWVAGGDRIPPPDEDGTKNFLELLKGIKDESPGHLWTAHWNGNSVRFDPAAPQSLDVALFRPYLDLNGIYTYEDRGGFVHEHMLDAYQRSDFKPAFLWEAHYEGPNHFGYVTPPEMVRRQAYEAVLSGGTGHVSGSMFIWSFGFPVAGHAAHAWERNLDSPGVLDMGRLRMLITDRAWYELVPDIDHELITSGYGTKGTSAYITAAAAPDGRLALAYVPSTGTASRSFVVALRRLTGPIMARWYNPTDGTYTTVAGSPFGGGEQTFVKSGDNGSGANDWILVLETTAR